MNGQRGRLIGAVLSEQEEIGAKGRHAQIGGQDHFADHDGEGEQAPLSRAVRTLGRMTRIMMVNQLAPRL